MKQHRFILWSCAALIAASVGSITKAAQTSSCPDKKLTTVKCFPNRSTGRHKERIVAGLTDYTHRCDADSWYWTFNVTPGYSSSFRPTHIAECLFGSHLVNTQGSKCRTIKIQGSAVEKRHQKAWLAEYFYLPRNFDGTFTITPRVKTVFIDFDLYVGLDCFYQGVYARLHGPFAHTRWDLNFCENAGLQGNNGAPLDHPQGYFSPAAYEGDKLVQQFGDYANGEIPEVSTGVPTATNDTITFQKLKYAKICRNSRHENGFADLRFELGWNFWCCPDYHIGVNLQVAAPTGKKKDPCYLFDARVGNGNHWEFGGGITGHYLFWDCGDADLAFHLDASFTHLFSERQRRTFELKNKPNSAYMLAAKFGPNPDDGNQLLLAAGGTPASRQFALEYAPVANVSTVKVDVSAGIQADIVAMFTYRSCGLTWDFGYNFWARSCEKIDCIKNCNDNSVCDPRQRNSWALKGDARMFGYVSTTNVVPLSATQNGATILNGTNQVDLNFNALDINAKVDSPVIGHLGGDPLVNQSGGANQINTSSKPLFLSCDSLELTRTRGMSHSVFSHLNRSWEWECWNPHLGIGASVEFAHHDNEDCRDKSPSECKRPCVDCGISQWSVWVKGGFSFSS